MSSVPDQLKDLISTELGEDAFRYLLNKNRGGSSGKKGSRYEDIFFGYKIAEVAVEYFGQPGPWPLVHSQVLGFVDDVVVRASSKSEYCQLKNVATLTWTGGEHPIATDFEYQHVIASKLGEPAPCTQLVVSDQMLYDSLRESIPDRIKDYTSVKYFPYADGSLNRVVLESTDLRELLRPLSKSENPTLDELEGVLGVLIISSFHHPEGGTVDELLRSANRKTPNQLRSLVVADLKQFIRDDFRAVLAAIPSLTYSFDKGFFTWSGFGTSGTFPQDCASEQFAEFQEEVVRQRPLTFEDFEGLHP